MPSGLGDSEALRKRFWSKVDVKDDPDACWLWLPKTKGTHFRPGGRGTGSYRAHRVAYALEIGPPCKGEHLRHACGNKRCCNPFHILEGSSTRGAIRLAMGPPSRTAGRTKFLPWEQDQMRKDHKAGSSVAKLREKYNAQVLVLLKILFGKI